MMDTIWRQLTYRDARDMASDHTVYRAILTDRLGYRGLYLAWQFNTPVAPLMSFDVPFDEWSVMQAPQIEKTWYFVRIRQNSPDTRLVVLDDHYARIRGRNLTDFKNGWPAIVDVRWIEYRPPGDWLSHLNQVVSTTEAAQLLVEGKH